MSGDWDAIRARADAATPGPWVAKTNLGGVHNLVDMVEDPAVFAMVFHRGVVAHTDAAEPNMQADTKFIAHAREDVPDLLAEVDRLNAELDKAEAALARVEALAAEYDHPERIWPVEAGLCRIIRSALAGPTAEPSDGEPTPSVNVSGTNMDWYLNDKGTEGD